MVLYAHSFVFYGQHEVNFLNLTSYGGLGVSIFFVISGYLITKSWDSDPDPVRFFIKRALRIFPALIVVVVLSAVLIGPIFSSLSIGDYFNHPFFLSYFKNIILYPFFALPGVLENVRFPNVLNGSLWSLPIEFFLYCLVLVVGFFLKSSKLLYLFLLMVFLLVLKYWIWPGAEMLVIYGSDVRQFFLAGIYFIIGACYCKFKLEKFFSLSGVAVAGFLIVFFAGLTYLSKYLLFVFLPYIVLAYGLSSSKLGSFFNKTGDYSYGFYIYAFPVQQLFLLKFPSVSYLTYLVSTTVITLFFSIVSWHFVEKKCLSFKPN